MTPSSLRRRLVSAALLVAATCTGGVGAAHASSPPASVGTLTATAGVGVDPSDPQAVLAAWGEIYSAQQPPPMGFTGSVSGCLPGTTSAAYRAAQLKVINGFRKLAGLDPLVENPAWTPLAQAAAVTMAANGRLSHTIDPSWVCYTTASAKGAAGSNLALGYQGPAAMVAYVGDLGAANAKVGHRRWLLCPDLGGIGLGNAPGANAVTVMGSGALAAGGRSRDGFVAWPNKGILPLTLAQGLGLVDRYSVQVGTDESIALANVTIASSQAATRGTVNVVELLRSDELYCSAALVWRTDRAPAVGETWTFTVKGVVNRYTGATRTLTWTTQMSAITPGVEFIKASYTDFLKRLPTAAEADRDAAAVWTGATSRAAYLTSLANSPEWVSVVVRKMYLDTLGREPDAAGLAAWVGLIRTGRLSVAQVAALFYSSQEFFTGAGQGQRSVWVERLYTTLLRRTPDAAGLAYWVTRAGDPAHGLTGVAGEFFQSQESRMTRVKALYAALLGRGPDSGGWAYWAGVIGSTGDLALAVSLASSREYDQRAQARF